LGKGDESMSEENGGLPTPPWWNSREARHAARGEERRVRRQERAARRHGSAYAAAPREPVTPERIADAALRVIDSQGLDGLTVRSLAQELGVGTMTLYWYIQNKDEVLDLVADRGLAAVQFPPADVEWRAGVRQVAVSMRDALLQHGNAVPVMVGRGVFGPNGLRLADKTMALMRSAGFDENDAAAAYFTMSSLVIGFCASLAAATAVTGKPSGPGSYPEKIRQYFDSLPPGLYPDLRAGMPWLFSASLEERFDFDLGCLIAGFEARLGASPAASQEEESKS
jgi:TetR/AcrR family tetracycline transcriptional repressor